MKTLTIDLHTKHMFSIRPVYRCSSENPFHWFFDWFPVKLTKITRGLRQNEWSSARAARGSTWRFACRVRTSRLVSTGAPEKRSCFWGTSVPSTPFSTEGRYFMKSDNFLSGCCCSVLMLCIVVRTWNKAVESNLKPSDPGCRTRDMADGSSSASRALKATSPNTLAWVSGWALSCGDEWCEEKHSRKCHHCKVKCWCFSAFYHLCIN